MARMVRVRSWYSKKLGKTITKTYIYEHKSTRGKTLVGKNGKVNKKNVDEFIKEINNNPELSAVQKRTMVNELRAEIRDRVHNNKKLTTTGFAGQRADTDVERMFYNVGIDPEEIAAEQNIDILDLIDKRNWAGDVFTINGVKYKFSFTYTGNSFVRV